MAEQFSRLEAEHRAFIERQHIFFVASTAPGARINLSPKGLEAFRVLGPRQVAYLDYTGSGNETAAHLLAEDRLTIMVCAFEGPASILRLYGRGAVHPLGTPGFEERIGLFERLPGARQIVTLAVDLVQTSCGFGVPRYTFEGQRVSLPRFAAREGEQGLARFRRRHNTHSIDGLPSPFALPDPHRGEPDSSP